MLGIILILKGNKNHEKLYYTNGCCKKRHYYSGNESFIIRWSKVVWCLNFNIKFTKSGCKPNYLVIK